MVILSNDYTPNIPGSTARVKGGPARFAKDFSTFVTEQGHAWIGLVPDNSIPAGTWAEQETVGTKRYIIAHADGFGLSYIRAIPPESIMEEYLQRHVDMVASAVRHANPDVVFLNGFSWFNWVLFTAARACGVPTIIQHAGVLAVEVDMYKDLFGEVGHAWSRAMERDVTEHADVNIFLNSYSREVLKERTDAVRIMNPHIVPLPHAGWQFEAVRTPGNKKERTLGVVARWDRIKNHQAILALAKAIREAGLPWTVRVVTSIPDTSRQQEFKREYREHVTVVPPMGRKELREFFHACDAMLLPSHFDVSPTVVMEATACGIPTLIAPTVGWVDEYSETGMESWMGDYSQPQKIIAQLQDNFSRGAWPELSTFAEYIQSRHNAETVFTQYTRLFEGVQR